MIKLLNSSGSRELYLISTEIMGEHRLYLFLRAETEKGIIIQEILLTPEEIKALKEFLEKEEI